jgi:DNA-directed RNA polymerase specialized sigma24 family protein
MSEEWFTYEEAAERLGVSAESIRQRAIRGRWHRTLGNDGKARVRLP